METFGDIFPSLATARADVDHLRKITDDMIKIKQQVFDASNLQQGEISTLITDLGAVQAQEKVAENRPELERIRAQHAIISVGLKRKDDTFARILGKFNARLGVEIERQRTIRTEIAYLATLVDRHQRDRVRIEHYRDVVVAQLERVVRLDLSKTSQQSLTSVKTAIETRLREIEQARIRQLEAVERERLRLEREERERKAQEEAAALQRAEAAERERLRLEREERERKVQEEAAALRRAEATRRREAEQKLQEEEAQELARRLREAKSDEERQAIRRAQALKEQQQKLDEEQARLREAALARERAEEAERLERLREQGIDVEREKEKLRQKQEKLKAAGKRAAEQRARQRATVLGPVSPPPPKDTEIIQKILDRIRTKNIDRINSTSALEEVAKLGDIFARLEGEIGMGIANTRRIIDGAQQSFDKKPKTQ